MAALQDLRYTSESGESAPRLPDTLELVFGRLNE